MNHTCLFRYLLLLPLFVLSIAAKADERVEWCMRTNYSQDIPLRNVDYLLQADTLSSQFHIVLYGGEVVQNVRSLRFCKTGSYGRATAHAAICEEAFAHNRRQSAAIIATPGRCVGAYPLCRWPGVVSECGDRTGGAVD